MPPFLLPARNRLLLFLLSFYCITASSQEPKGLKPAEQTVISTGKTRALVIGISDYLYIDKLNYAHRDAEIFASYLAGNKYWKAKSSDITLLINEQAKRGTILAELQRIAILSKPGDNLVFYFSGHGDVETITMFNKGYLLAYDTYSNNYMAGGVSVNDLKDVFVTLTSNNVKVIVITDACRSGKLAGGVKGTEFTATSLKPIWNNEIKILSSQPGQLSQEGKQWGDGRGVFSYYLVNGLEGAADQNRDSLITLSELEAYVGNIVSTSTHNDQQPIIDGPNKYSTIISNLKVQTVSTKPGISGGASFLRFRLPFDSCDFYYRKMDEAISQKKFRSGDPLSASAFYRKLKTCTNDNDLVLSANSKLLAALMNDAQEILNNTFIGKKFVDEAGFNYAISLYDEVLNNNDLRLPYQETLTNLKRYLKVMEATLLGNDPDLTQLDIILDSALKEEPEAAYLLSAKGILELRKRNYTKAIEILEQATRMSPGWLIPKYYLGIGYGYKRDYKKALAFYEEILQKDPEAKTFECAVCIQEKIKEYRSRISHIRYDKYSGDPRKNEFDSLRNQLTDNIDSAAFFYAMGNRFNKKNHPFRDSVYYFYTQAVTLDPWEIDYMYSLIDYLRKESYGEQEIRQQVLNYLKARDKEDLVEDFDDFHLNEFLLYSYIYSKEMEKAMTITTRLQENGFYDCKDLKKLKKHLGNLAQFKELFADCE